ncbi:MAG: FAD-dependent oxidoreductase [Pseudoruegeria sp.]
MTHVVLIGAGQAASSLAFKLRNLGYEGDITIIGEEPVLPYQRPPLSKAYLLGDMARDRLFLRPQNNYDEANISVQLGERVTALSTTDKTIHLGDNTLSYDELVLTTGSKPIRLPAAVGGDLRGVFCVRTLDDIDAMSSEFREGARVLIVGGGYIGLEAAAVAAKLGLNVTVVEMADRILQRVASEQTSNYFRSLHQKHGVDICEGVGLSKLEGDAHVKRALLSNGDTIDVDFVICGIGIRPNTQLAEAAGIALENGIKTDSHGRTSDPHIWAAGDCASFPNNGQHIRLESVPNAIDQGEIIAANITGADKPYVAKPWFWSDQYDVKLQIAGLNSGFDRVVVRPGDTPNCMSHWYYKKDKLLAVDAMNAPRHYMVGKRLIEAGKSPAAELISDSETDLKSLLK